MEQHTYVIGGAWAEDRPGIAGTFKHPVSGITLVICDEIEEQVVSEDDISDDYVAVGDIFVAKVPDTDGHGRPVWGTYRRLSAET